MLSAWFGMVFNYNGPKSKKNITKGKKEGFLEVFSLTFAAFAGISYSSVKDSFGWCTGGG